jgi:hypothetical protein
MVIEPEMASAADSNTIGTTRRRVAAVAARVDMKISLVTACTNH